MDIFGKFLFVCHFAKALPGMRKVFSAANHPECFCCFARMEVSIITINKRVMARLHASAMGNLMITIVRRHNYRGRFFSFSWWAGRSRQGMRPDNDRSRPLSIIEIHHRAFLKLHGVCSISGQTNTTAQNLFLNFRKRKNFISLFIHSKNTKKIMQPTHNHKMTTHSHSWKRFDNFSTDYRAIIIILFYPKRYFR